jgi:GPH family glycoside/pentoside/hexuronide:cation symporter
VNALTLPLIQAFGHGDKARGYQMTVILFAAIATACFLGTFFFTRERIQPPPEQKTNLLNDLGRLFTNVPWLIMCVAGGSIIFSIVRGAGVMYYCKYYLGIENSSINMFGLFSMDDISFFLTIGSLGFIAGAATLRQWVKVLGKKNLYIVTLLLSGVLCGAIYFVPPAQLDVAYVIQVLIGFVGGINAPLYFAMIGDTADFAEWKFKVRTTGIIFSSSSFVQKVGLGLGGVLTTFLLSHYGYVAGAVQSAASNHGILLMVSLIPAVGSVLVALAFFFYPLDEEFCHRIRDDLALRRLE